MKRGVPKIFEQCGTYLATARCQRVLGSAAVFSNRFAVLLAPKFGVAARNAHAIHVRGARETKGGRCGRATEVGKVWEQVAWLHV
jgi:hypothetical protein